MHRFERGEEEGNKTIQSVVDFGPRGRLATIARHTWCATGAMFFPIVLIDYSTSAYISHSNVYRISLLLGGLETR